MRSSMRSFVLAALVLAAGSLTSCRLFRARPPVYDAVTLENGLFYQDEVVPEEGPAADLGDEVSVHYEMWLPCGEKVDSSLDRGQPITFVLGEGQVPEGFELGVLGMRLYGRRRLTMPPELGYGEGGLPPLIPPRTSLHLHLELIELHPAADPRP